MHEELAAHLNRQLQETSELSLPDFAVLVCLTEAPDGRLRAFELGRTLAWEKSRLSHHLSRMERRGLVARQHCPSDRRGAFLVATERGRAAITAAAPGHARAVRRVMFDALSPAQVRTLAAISSTVLGRLATERDGAGCLGEGDGSSPCA